MPGSLRPRLFAVLVAVFVLAAAGPGHAATVEVGPNNAEVGLVAYVLGLMPRSGRFTEFSGQIFLDPAHPEDCRVKLHVSAASLRMFGSIGDLARGPGLLDVAHYPAIDFSGKCGLRKTSGELTLHGVTRLVNVNETRTGDAFEAAGTVSRGDFGMNGWPGAVGSTIAMHFSVSLPASLAGALPR